MSLHEKSHVLLNFQRKLFNSRFFTISLLLHFILIVSFGGTVLFNKYAEAPDFTGEPGGNFVQPDTSAAPPPPQQKAPLQPTATMNAPATTAPTQTFDAITTMAPTQTAFSMPQIATPVLSPGVDTAKLAAPTGPAVKPGQLSMQQAKDIAGFTRGWVKNKVGQGPGTSPRNREFEFTAYLAKYGNPNDPKRGGDWASTNWVRNGKIVGGSLPNLLYFMNKFSRDKIHASPQAIPLDLSSDEIFSKKPPFIFFTGHRDFVLTDGEVENLQKYVRLGGCIWGDSSLPGRRSRFDLAFRREMRRVIADVNKDWEELPPDHAMYVKNTYYPEIKEAPAAVNYYKEKVYALKFGPEVAVIYTSNDYGDMWQFGLTDKLDWDRSEDEKGNWLATNRWYWDLRTTYLRNVALPTVHAAYRFGTNLVIHLITRWEDHLRMIPQGL